MPSEQDYGPPQAMTCREMTVVACAIVVVIMAQLLFTWVAMPRLMYEETAESIRNPYWLSQGLLFDRVSSNIGWYGTLALVYSAVGFDCYLAKWVRYGFHVVGVIVLARLLVRWQGPIRGAALLLLCGFSSTWIYFNTHQASFGIDLQYLPIVLGVIYSRRISDSTRSAATGALLSIACLSYPGALFYLPSAIWLLATRVAVGSRLQRPIEVILRCVVPLVLGFYVPIGLSLCYLTRPEVLVSGLFRGGGKGVAFEHGTIKRGISRVHSDLFEKPKSYCFDLPHAELSGGVGRGLACLVGGASCVYLLSHRRRWKQGKYTTVLAMSTLLAACALFVPSIVPNEPGMRRSTGLLAAYYAAASVAVVAGWEGSFTVISFRIQSRIAWGAFLLHVGFSVVTWARNSWEYSILAGQANDRWLCVRAMPRESISAWYYSSENGEPLRCDRWLGKCRLADRYACIKAQHTWNRRRGFIIYFARETSATKDLAEVYFPKYP